MTRITRLDSELIWFSLSALISLLFWNIFFYIKYPAEGPGYFWDFFLMPGDWEFRLPVIITIGLVYVVRFAVRAIRKFSSRSR